MVVCKRCKAHTFLCGVLAQASIVAAVVFSCLAATSCNFVKRGMITYGLFSYGLAGTCNGGYGDGGFDHGWIHAWAGICGALAPALGGLAALLLLLECLCRVPCGSVIQSLALSGAGSAQAFTFLLYVSGACTVNVEEEGMVWGITFKDGDLQGNWGACGFARGSLWSAIAFGCYVVAGCFLCLFPRQDPLLCRNNGNGTSPERKSKKKDEGTAFKDEESGTAADDPQGQTGEVKPQLY